MYLTLLPDSIAESAHFKKSAADWMDIFSSLTALSADRLTLAPRPSQGPLPGADPGFQVRGGALKKLRRAEGGAKNFGVFRVKNHDFTPKNHMFSNFRGGARRVRNPPPWIRPCSSLIFVELLTITV